MTQTVALAHAADVRKLIRKGRFDDGDASNIKRKLQTLSDAADRIFALEQLGIVHHDIKPENLLVVEGVSDPQDYTVYLADFGLSSRLDPELEPARGAGTKGYQAPEVAKGGLNCVKADIYSLGVTCLDVYLGLDDATRQLLDTDPCAQLAKFLAHVACMHDMADIFT